MTNMRVNLVPNANYVTLRMDGTGRSIIRNLHSSWMENTPQWLARAAISMLSLLARPWTVSPVIKRMMHMREDLAINAGPVTPPRIGRPQLSITTQFLSNLLLIKPNQMAPLSFARIAM